MPYLLAEHSDIEVVPGQLTGLDPVADMPEPEPCHHYCRTTFAAYSHDRVPHDRIMKWASALPAARDLQERWSQAGFKNVTKS